MWNRRISKTGMITDMIIIFVVSSFIASRTLVVADGGLDSKAVLATEILRDEVQSTEESDGRETSKAETEEVDLTGQFETTTGFEENSGIFPSRKLRHTQGEGSSDVAVIETTLSDATKVGPVTPTTSMQGHSSAERALPKWSSSERNRKLFSGFRQQSPALQPETTVVSSFKMENLSPQLSSWENSASLSSSPSFTVQSNSRGHFLTLSSYTANQEDLLKKTSTVLRMFTEKTILSSAIAASPFIALSQSNFGQTNRASEPTSRSSDGLLLSHWASRQNLSSGMKRETRVTAEGQQHQTANALTKETLSMTQNKVLAATSFRVNSVKDTTFRPAPTVSVKTPTSSISPDRSRNFESSGAREMSTPSVIEHSIPTTLLSRIPMLSSSPVVTVKQSHDQFSKSAVTFLPETTDEVFTTRNPKMMASVIDYPSVRSSSIPATESGLAIASTNSTQFINDKAATSKQMFSSSRTKSKPDLTGSSLITTQDNESKVETSILDRTSANFHKSVWKSAPVLESKTVASDLPRDVRTLVSGEVTWSTVHKVETPTLLLTVNVTSVMMMVIPSSSAAYASPAHSRQSVETSYNRTQALNSSSQIMESTKKNVDKTTPSESQVSHRRTVVLGNSSGFVKTLSSKTVITPSTSSSTSKVSVNSSTTKVLLPSREGLHMSLASYVVVSSTTEPLPMSPKSRLFLETSATTLVRGTTKTNKLSKSSTTAILLPSQEGLHTSLLSSVVVSSSTEPLPMSSKSRRFLQASPTTLVRETTKPSKVSKSSTTTVLLPSQEGPISLPAVMSPILPRSSRVVKQRTTVSSSLSRDHDVKPGVDQTSVAPKPSPASTTHESPSLTLIGMTPIPSLGPKAKATNSSHLAVLIVVATVPSVFLGIIIGLLICRHRGRHKRNGTRYSIKVEYTDEVRRRRKRTNSRLDLAVHGIHIDLEFPTSADARDSVRVSRGTHLSEGQIRELQLLSKECNQKLEWLNEVLAKEVVSPFSGTDSGILFRDSSYESGGKIVRRESSRRSRDNFKLRRLLSRDKDSSAECGESIEIKVLPTAGEEAPEKTSPVKNCTGEEGCTSKKEVKLPPEGEATEADLRSAETEDENIDSSSGNKMRYYPLARTRNESTRSRFETL